jgi:hypothetical protein
MNVNMSLYGNDGEEQNENGNVKLMLRYLG